MLTEIIAVAPPGAYWSDLPTYLVPPSGDPLQIRNVTGLEPVPATINTQPYGGIDGEFPTGNTIGKRNIVITYGIGHYSVEAGRTALYRNFPIKSPIQLKFRFSDRDDLIISGYVESITGDRFQPDPEMQVSFICPKPNLFSVEPIVVNGTSGDSPDEILTQYSGDAGGGFTLELFATGGDYSGQVFIDHRVGEVAYDTMGFSFLTIPDGWEFFVSTHQGNKRAELRPPSGIGEDPVNLYENMDDILYWMQFYASNFGFRVRTEGGVELPWTLIYTDQWMGV